MYLYDIVESRVDCNIRMIFLTNYYTCTCTVHLFEKCDVFSDINFYIETQVVFDLEENPQQHCESTIKYILYYIVDDSTLVARIITTAQLQAPVFFSVMAAHVNMHYV